MTLSGAAGLASAAPLHFGGMNWELIYSLAGSQGAEFVQESSTERLKMDEFLAPQPFWSSSGTDVSETQGKLVNSR